MTNVVNFPKPTEDFNIIAHDDVEVILINDHEETRQAIRCALGYDIMKGVQSYG